MRKKTFIAVLLAVVLAATALALVGCGDKNDANKIVLVDFPSTQTVEAQKLGDTYQLRRTVKDEAGNAYDLVAVVKTTAGDNVNVVAAQFELTDLGGYVVTYTATVGEKDVRTSVVTVPVYDGDAPVIVIDKPENGLVGQAYTLPTITFTDASQIAEKTVKVFKVDGETLTEKSLTESEGKYTFTPDAIGYYRISAYAKDAAGYETTRTADFTVDTLLVGEVFNPASLGARNQLRNSSEDAGFEYVSADENDDATYGGAYWIVDPHATGWKNTYLTPRLDLSEYADYDVILCWFYAQSTVESGTFTLPILNDADLQQKGLLANTWKLIEIPVDKFIEKVDTQYLYAINYGSLYAARIGEVMAKKRTDYAVTDLDVATLGNGGGVTFTVTGSSDYTVTVTDAKGNQVEGLTNTDDNYSMTATQAGDYTITVAPVDAVNYGTVTVTFTVYQAYRIEVDGTYPVVLPAAELDLLPANVYSGSTVVADKTVTASVYKKNGEDWEAVDGVAQGKFTPTAGEYKVVYRADNAEDVEQTFTVRGAYGEVFDPSAVYSGEQITATGAAFTGTVKTVVSAEENTDTTYDGAYVQYSIPGTGWSDIGITPTFAREQYAEFDYVTVWIYMIQKEGVADGTVMLAIGNTAPHRRCINTGKWTQIKLVKCYDGMTGTYADNVFFADKPFGNAGSVTFNFAKFFTASWSVNTEYVRIGEIKAGKFNEADKTETTVFDPVAQNAVTHFGRSGSGTLNTADCQNPDTTGAYGGACFSWTPTASGWQNLYMSPITGDWQELSNYQLLKVWVYVETTADGTTELTMFNDASSRQKVDNNTWVEVTLNMGMYADYIRQKPIASTSKGNPYFISFNGFNGTIYIGTATAVKLV